MNLSQYPTLVDALRDRAAAAPEMRLITFLNEDGRIDHLTYHELFDQAHAYAAALGRLGAWPGDLVILVMNHALELLPAFWGALLTGVVPSIFPYQTEKLDADIYRRRVRRLVEESGARFVVTFAAFQPALVELFTGLPITVVRVDELAQLAAQSIAAPLPALDRDQTAFIQYSSGTTGLQKGVVRSHRAALNNIQAIAQAVELRADDVVVLASVASRHGADHRRMMLPIRQDPGQSCSPFQWVRDPSLLEPSTSMRHAAGFNFAQSLRAQRSRAICRSSIGAIGARSSTAANRCASTALRLFAERFAPLVSASRRWARATAWPRSPARCASPPWAACRASIGSRCARCKRRSVPNPRRPSSRARRPSSPRVGWCRALRFRSSAPGMRRCPRDTSERSSCAAMPC
jgi:hypothetical protein